jgi:hypothetical protein
VLGHRDQIGYPIPRDHSLDYFHVSFRGSAKFLRAPDYSSNVSLAHTVTEVHTLVCREVLETIDFKNVLKIPNLDRVRSATTYFVCCWVVIEQAVIRADWKEDLDPLLNESSNPAAHIVRFQELIVSHNRVVATDEWSSSGVLDELDSKAAQVENIVTCMQQGLIDRCLES